MPLELGLVLEEPIVELELDGAVEAEDDGVDELL